jgi:hypothetical protein
MTLAMTLPRTGVVSWGPRRSKVLNPGLLAKHTKMGLKRIMMYDA